MIMTIMIKNHNNDIHYYPKLLATLILGKTKLLENYKETFDKQNLPTKYHKFLYL